MRLNLKNIIILLKIHFPLWFFSKNQRVINNESLSKRSFFRHIFFVAGGKCYYNKCILLYIVYIFYTKIQGKTDHECSRTHNYTQRYYFNTTILRTQIPIILALKFQEILKNKLLKFWLYWYFLENILPKIF